MRPPDLHFRFDHALALALVASGGGVTRVAASEGVVARGIDGAFLIAAAIVFGIVASLIGWRIFNYRQEDLPGESPSRPMTSMRLELVWWALPTVLALVLFILTAQVLSSGEARNGDPTDQATPGTSPTH